MTKKKKKKKCKSPQYFFLIKNPHPFYSKKKYHKEVICLRLGDGGEINMGKESRAESGLSFVLVIL